MDQPMLSLAINRAPRPYPSMGLTVSAETAERKVLGKALAALRERAGMTQFEAALACGGISTQAWQRYEAGARRFTDPQIAKITAAVNASPEDLMVQRARILGHDETDRADSGFAAREPRSFEISVIGRTRMGPGGPRVEAGASAEGVIDLRGLRSPAVGATRIADETMIPWGAPGELTIFDRDRWPKKGMGCVLETLNGDLMVKLYDHADGGQVYVQQYNPEKIITFKLSELKGVYAIRLRGD